MLNLSCVEFEVGASVANEYIGKLSAGNQEYILQPKDDQPSEVKHFILQQKGKGFAMTEIILHENGTWTAIMTLPVYEDSAA